MSAHNGSSALPLADAARRLRGRPGRPRTTGAAQASPTSVGAVTRMETGDARGAVPTLCPVTPRLLDAESAARYLAVSIWTVRDLEAAGHLSRVRLPLPGGKDVRRILFDLRDLDRLIERSKSTTAF